MKMNQRSQGGVYEKEKESAWELEGAGGRLEGLRRAARWPGPVVGETQFAAVLRLLRGEDLETLSRELGVTAAALSGWRDQFLEGGAANLKAREVDVDDEETQRLKSLVAD